MSRLCIRKMDRMRHWPTGRLPCPATIRQQIGWAWPNDLPRNQALTACRWSQAIYARQGSHRVKDHTAPAYGARWLPSHIPVQCNVPQGDIAADSAVPWGRCLLDGRVRHGGGLPEVRGADKWSSVVDPGRCGASLAVSLRRQKQEYK